MTYQGRAQGVSFTNQLRKVEQMLDMVRDEFLRRMAEEIARSSPVYSGDYIMSHSVGGRSQAGQFLRSVDASGWGKRQDRDLFVGRALEQMYSEIDALPKDQTLVSISNSVPHAEIVEFGGMHTTPYMVYHNAREKAPIILKEIEAELKGSL